METHYEEALISLKRKYGKDDLIRSMIAENNKLKAQIDELDEYRCKADKKAEQLAQKQVDLLFEQIDKLKRENKKLRDTNICLILKVKEYEKAD